jgi:hypothetical protein
VRVRSAAGEVTATYRQVDPSGVAQLRGVTAPKDLKVFANAPLATSKPAGEMVRHALERPRRTPREEAADPRTRPPGKIANSARVRSALAAQGVANDWM